VYTKAGNVSSLLLVGGLEGLLTVHEAPERQRPRMVLQGVFKQAVTDAAWHPGGQEALVCSRDGTVARLFLPPALTGQVCGRRVAMARLHL
jgi:hypothetical protein